MEMWNEKPVNYSSSHVFGCPAYVMYKFQERIKLDLRSKRYIFLCYVDGVKGYHLWDLTACKVIVSRDVIFAEREL